jgi:hypothetical protein
MTEPDFTGAKPQPKIGSQQGSVEGVPSRSVGHMDRGLLGPTQDQFTESTRAHYGESPTYIDFGGAKTEGLRFDVNNVENKGNWITRDEVIRMSNEDQSPQTGFGRASTQ